VARERDAHFDAKGADAGGKRSASPNQGRRQKLPRARDPTSIRPETRRREESGKKGTTSGKKDHAIGERGISYYSRPFKELAGLEAKRNESSIVQKKKKQPQLFEGTVELDNNYTGGRKDDALSKKDARRFAKVSRGHEMKEATKGRRRMPRAREKKASSLPGRKERENPSKDGVGSNFVVRRKMVPLGAERGGETKFVKRSKGTRRALLQKKRKGGLLKKETERHHLYPVTADRPRMGRRLQRRKLQPMEKGSHQRGEGLFLEKGQ